MRPEDRVSIVDIFFVAFAIGMCVFICGMGK